VVSTGAKEYCSANCMWITVFKYNRVKVSHELRGLEEELGKDAVFHQVYSTDAFTALPRNFMKLKIREKLICTPKDVDKLVLLAKE